MASAAFEAETTGSAKARFILTIFAGSFLLFLVQPMIARMALPRLGGAPSVWNSAMLVYQALLLAGYAYAHWLGRFNGRVQSIIHLALFAVAALMLPIGLAAGNPPADANPFIWVPWLLLTSIGPLFFVVSAQAPLMQRWFTLSGGGDPYPLYAASNLGSFSGLIAYPLIVEPLLPVATQSMVWSAGYAVLALLVLFCGLSVPKAAIEAHVAPNLALKPQRKAVAWWIALAAIPSGLMLSTTLHLTTDIVAMPLLWVLPLGLYLLSFSVAFSARRGAAQFLTRIAPLTLLIAGCGVFVDVTSWPFVFAFASLANLFVVSVALHSAMFDRRPDPSYLTGFYLAMSVGGVLGGLFCALVAPLVFDWTYEHPILMVAAALVIAQKPFFSFTEALWNGDERAARYTRWGAVLLILVSLVGQGGFALPESREVEGIVALVIIALAILTIGNRILFAFALAGLMLCLGGWTKMAMSITPGLMTRSFFGVYSVRSGGPNARLLVHGTTVHGVQNRGSVAREMMPASYYAPQSGIGIAMTAAPVIFGPHARIGVVGLGSGTLSCYARPGETWRFYEIDPVIAGIARDPKRFTFLARCLPHADIAIGDARIVLGQEPANTADLLAIDAFSSDAVPMHLLTREAFETYRRHIAANGLLMVHISNRYLDLTPVVAAAGREGWVVKRLNYRPDPAKDANKNYSASNWIALSPSADTIAKLVASAPSAKWTPLQAKPGFSPWTDDHASILPIIKYGKD